jgi:hypothetical protein
MEAKCCSKIYFAIFQEIQLFITKDVRTSNATSKLAFILYGLHRNITKLIPVDRIRNEVPEVVKLVKKVPLIL